MPPKKQALIQAIISFTCIYGPADVGDPVLTNLLPGED